MVEQAIKIEVIVFRVLNDKYEYLLLKRIPARGAFWQPVTGKLESGESEADAVKRELREETGIIEVKRVIGGIYAFSPEGEPNIVEHVFAVEITPDISITIDDNTDKEHEEYRWCLYAEAVKLLKWPGNKQGLANLHKILE